MGVCSSSPEERDHSAQSAKITSDLHKQSERSKSQIKLLLLGAGECGKSTILKQMKILHKNGFTQNEQQESVAIVHKNTLESIHALIHACFDLEIPFSTPEQARLAEEVLQLDQLFPSNDTVQMLQSLWLDDAIQKAFLRQNEFTLLDSAPYFLSNVARTFSPGYLPTDQDILRTRLATTGVIETDFWIDKLQFSMIHCFEEVRAILFIASLNEYDQVLAEDRTRNRLLESLSLFEGIISLPWFKNTAIILFLNKNDLFQQKIVKTDLGIYFNAYVGGLDYEEGLYFIKEEFFGKNHDPGRTIYAHVTDATDTNHIAFVWKCTKHIVMQQNLTRAGLIMN